MRSTIFFGSSRQPSLPTLQCWKYQRVIPKMQSVWKGITYGDGTVTRLYSQSASDGNRSSVSSRDPATGKDGRHQHKGIANVTSQSSLSIDPESETDPHDATNFVEKIDSSDNYLSSTSPETQTPPSGRNSVRISPEQRATISKNIENAVRNTREIQKLTKPRIIASVTAHRVRSLLELLFASPQHPPKLVLPTYNDRKEVAESSETDMDDASYFPELSKVAEDRLAGEEFLNHQERDVKTNTSNGFLEPEIREPIQQEIHQATRAIFVNVAVPTLKKTDFVRLLAIDPGHGNDDQRRRAREFLDYLEFEFIPNRDNLNRRKGYYLRFKTVEAAELYKRRTDSVIIYGKQMKDRSRFVSVGACQPDSRLEVSSNAGRSRTSAKYVLLHDLPLSVTLEQVQQKLSDFRLDGNPSQAIRNIPS
ncbi:hypothetical protein V1509DRAFT_634001 [Lipomyces kononenkoae]